MADMRRRHPAGSHSSWLWPRYAVIVGSEPSAQAGRGFEIAVWKSRVTHCTAGHLGRFAPTPKYHRRRPVRRRIVMARTLLHPKRRGI